MYNLVYNGVSNKDIGVEIIQRPDIPSAERNIEEQSIPGRDGLLIYDYKSYSAISIDIKMNFKSEPDDWHNYLFKIKNWLTGGNILRLSDLKGYFYKVKYIKLGECERSSKWIGTITATFVCEPFVYSDEGLEEIINPTILNNLGYTAEPIYIITGNGICTLIVNGNIMQANVQESLTIDINLQRSYLTISGRISNTSVKGDYEKLKLTYGSNSISITNGFELCVIPNWRHL